MTEQQNTHDYTGYPQLDAHPQQLNQEVAEKDSALNQDLNACAQWLRDNKSKAGSEEYLKNMGSLKTMAEKGYPMAEFEYAKFLTDIGELNQAAIYFEKAKLNENAGEELKKQFHEQTPDNPSHAVQRGEKEAPQPTKDKERNKESKEEKLTRDPYKTLAKHSHENQAEAQKFVKSEQMQHLVEQIQQTKGLGQG